VEVIAEGTGEILYCVRVRGSRFQHHVYSQSSFTVKIGRNRPDGAVLAGVKASVSKNTAGTRRIRL
jgi:hypothetical protein